MNFEFFIVSIMFGFGLAMDAFSVALANGMNEKRMKIGRMCKVAGVFAFFQALMPLLGWVAVHTILEYFNGFSKFIPYIALGLLSYIGGKMIYEGIKKDCDCEDCAVGFWGLIVQGIATSIDALSVGLDIGEYNLSEALMSSLVIALVTFIICMFGVWAGKKFGNMLSNKATVFGGVILVGIGIYIFIKGILGI
jgi:putative Mn2+ efflux pump MntP